MSQGNTFHDIHTSGGQAFAGNQFSGNTINFNTNGAAHLASARSRLLQAFGPTDPEAQRRRILASKDVLHEELCSWIFEQDKFNSWWCAEQNVNVLWLHGDPGKGKTVIMAAATNNISQWIQREPDSEVFAYFFCQQQHPRLNNAIAVLKGLLYSMVSRCDAVVEYLQNREIGSNEGNNGASADDASFWKLQSILLDLLDHCDLPRTCLLIDALDECVSGIGDLLRLIEQSTHHRRIRWMLSSRNDGHIKERLDHSLVSAQIDLELNTCDVSAAVRNFINFKVEDLSQRKHYSPELTVAVQEHLVRNAQDTFLWVALVC